MTHRLRFGIFLAPFHKPGINPTLALESDLELIRGSIAAATMRRGSASIIPPARRFPPRPRS